MKSLILIIVLWASVAGAQDVIRDPSGMPIYVVRNPCIEMIDPETMKPMVKQKPTPTYQFKIIHEFELERHLNDGWEFERVYSIVVQGGTTMYPGAHEHTINMAIVKRRSTP